MKKITYFFATILIFLSSCAAFHPQPVDIPLIRERGDLRMDGGIFIVPPNNNSNYFGAGGGHLTISYGITDILAVQVYASRTEWMSFQFAPGFFKSFENNTVIEFYSGYGAGGGQWGYQGFWSSYEYAFAQFNIGRIGTRLDYGVGLKSGYTFSYIDFANEWRRIFPHRSGWTIEPTAMIRFGGERVKFSTRINYLWTRTIDQEYYFPWSFSIGMNINLNTLRLF